MHNSHRLKPSQLAQNMVINVIATGLWAIAINMVIIPNQIAPGGATGITVTLNYVTGLQIGLMSFLINLPLLIWAWKLLGRTFVLQTLLTITTFSVMVDVIVPLFPSIPTYTTDPLMGAILAGVLNGIGTGLVFMYGSSGGGTDLMIKIFKHIYPHLSVGQIVLIVNSMVMSMSAFVYGSFDALLYGLVMTFTSGQIVDLILNGAASANSIYIITSCPNEISEQITHQLHRSATIIQGEGAYSHHNVSMMFCVVRKHELHKLRELVQRTDPKAFLVIHDAKQVFGGNFVSKNPTP